MGAGRPLKFKSAEELQSKIDEYFDHCDNRIRYVYSKKRDEVVEIIDPEPYTMAGLAYALGVDRDTILNYEKRENYSALIKEARIRVQTDVERRLMEGSNAAGAIFNLKNNFGYKDRTETDITSRGESIAPKIVSSIEPRNVKAQSEATESN